MRAQSLRILLREASKQTIDDGRFDMTSGEEQIVGLLARRRRDTRDLVVLVFDQTIHDEPADGGSHQGAADTEAPGDGVLRRSRAGFQCLLDDDAPQTIIDTVSPIISPPSRRSLSSPCRFVGCFPAVSDHSDCVQDFVFDAADVVERFITATGPYDISWHIYTIRTHRYGIFQVTAIEIACFQRRGRRVPRPALKIARFLSTVCRDTDPPMDSRRSRTWRSIHSTVSPDCPPWLGLRRELEACCGGEFTRY